MEVNQESSQSADIFCCCI